MIVVDTSVWVDYLRPRATGVSRLRARIDQLLDEDQVALAIPVRIELLSGAGKQMQATLARVLSALPSYAPGPDTWRMMEGWALQASQRGFHFGVGDLLIGALATEQGAQVWSLDSDFTAMAKLGFIGCFAP